MIATADRNRGVSALRGIAIAMVVLGHINRGILEGRAGSLDLPLRVLDFVLYTAHMPVFFYLAGYFTHQALGNKAPGAFAKSRWASIVYPYLLWSLITVIAHFLISHIVRINHPVPLWALSQIAWAPINVLWFLYALLCMQLTAVLFRHRPYTLLVVAIAASLSATTGVSFLQGNVAGKIAAHAPFFAIGFALAAAGQSPIPERLKAGWFCGAALAFWVAACAVIYHYGVKDPTSLSMLPISIIGVAGLASASLILTRSSKSVIGAHFVKMGDASLPIYLLHSFTLALIPRAMRSLGVQSPLIELVAGLAIGVYLSWGIYLIVMKIGLDGLLGFNAKKVPRVGAKQR